MNKFILKRLGIYLLPILIPIVLYMVVTMVVGDGVANGTETGSENPTPYSGKEGCGDKPHG